MLRLKELRILNNKTQYEIAKEVGMSVQVLSRYELEQRAPDNIALISFANYYNVSIDYILGRTEKPFYSQELLSDDLNELICSYNKLSKDNRIRAIAYINGLLDTK